MFQTINLSTITFSSCSCTIQFLEPSGCIYSRLFIPVKTHNEVTPFYRHFEHSETFGTASHQVRKLLQVRLTHAQTFFRGVSSTWFQLREIARPKTNEKFLVRYFAEVRNFAWQRASSSSSIKFIRQTSTSNARSLFTALCFGQYVTSG
jgi:hypothetical protein